jgi:hypothetical protein
MGGRQSYEEDMRPLSEDAGFVLERMEPDRRYNAEDLRALVPGASFEHLREIMHELWVARQVERIGYAGWRRHRSASAEVPDAGSREVTLVKPEDLFDHTTFADFFK